VSRRLNGWQKESRSSVAPSTLGNPFLNPFEDPETIDLRERSLRPLPLDGFVGAETEELTETEQLGLSEALKPLEEVRDYQVRLMLLTLIEKEAHFPIQDLTISMNEVGATHRVLTSKPITQRVVWQAVAREGESLSSWTKWWLRMFIWVISLVLLSSLAMKIASWQHLNGPIVSIAGLPASIPLWLVVGFSLGLLVQRLDSYGWLHLLRLFSLRVSRLQCIKDWREGSHSRTDILPLRRRRG
jgi:hypothetical protein